jgi:hypothetical protein
MDRRVLVVVAVVAVLVAGLLVVVGLDTGPEPAPTPTVAEAPPARGGEAPQVPPASRLPPIIPVADPDAPDDPDALTDDERSTHKVTAQAVLEGAVRLCLGEWAAEEGRTDEPVTVRVRAITTEAGLSYLSMRPPDDAPADARDCLEDAVHGLPWPALPRFGELEETWRFTTLPGDGSETMADALARVLATHPAP